MPILHTHGSIDSVVPYTGLASYIDGWISKNGCPSTAQITKPYPATNSNSKVTKEYYGPCSQGSEIIVLIVDGMGHAYPGSFGSTDINASEEFWAFFKTHPPSSGISNQVSGARIARPVSVVYNSGKIHLQSERKICTIHLLDIQGKVIFSWKTGADPVRSFAFPINRSAAGIYLLGILSDEGQSMMRVVVP
jgi:hypothetical protein